MNVMHCCQMSQLVAKEISFGLGWNSPSHVKESAVKFESGFELVVGKTVFHNTVIESV